VWIPAVTAALMLISAGLTVAGAPATPAATPSPGAAGLRLTVTADAVDVDATTRTVRATGRVRVTDGTIIGTASRGVLYHAQGRGILTGHARVTGPQGVLVGGEIAFAFAGRTLTRIAARGDAALETAAGRLSGATITITPATDTVVAEERVTFLAPPDVVASGRRLTVERTRGRAVLDGDARLRTSDGFILGERMEGTDRLDRVTVGGGVVGRFRDIDARSRTAEYDAQEKKIVFIGDADITQAGRRMLSDRVTVWYAAGRVVAEGATRIRIDPTP